VDAEDDKDILSAADAFMQRLRPPADEDVPLLTEIVENAGLLPLPESANARETLASELEYWLDMHLPEAVLKVLDGVADQLVLQVGEQARRDLLPRLVAALGTPSATNPPEAPAAGAPED